MACLLAWIPELGCLSLLACQSVLTWCRCGLPQAWPPSKGKMERPALWRLVASGCLAELPGVPGQARARTLGGWRPEATSGGREADGALRPVVPT